MRDVIVIGAGAAGSVCAGELSKRGFSVALLEKDVPGKAICAGGIGPRIYEILKLPNKVIEKYVYRVNVYSPNSKISIKLKKPNASIYREKFDKFLAERAVDNGTELFTSTLALDIKRNKVITKKKEFKGKVIVCADGVNSLLSKFRREKQLLAITKEYEIKNVEETDYHIFYINGLGPLGYGWIIPKKNAVTLGVLGFIGHLNGNISFYLDYLLKEHPLCSKMLSKGKITQTKGAMIPYKASKQMVFGNKIGVGDAVGLTSPLTGGGIYYASLSGGLAANVIAKNLEIGYDLKNYEKEWRKTHGKSISMQWKLNILLRKLWTDKGWDICLRKISKNKEFSKILASSWATYKFEKKSVWLKTFALILWNLFINKF